MRNAFNIFKNEKEKVNLTQYRLLNTYDNCFTAYNSSFYDDATVRTCIDCIAKHCAKLKPVLKQTNNKLEYILNNRPNEYMSTYDFIYKIVTQLYVYNNAFVYIRYDKTGNLVGLYPLNYQDVELVESAGELYCTFKFLTGLKITVSYNSIIHLRKHFNNNDFFGQKNDIALKNTLTILDTVKKALVNSVKNCNKLRGFIKFNTNLRPSEMQKRVQDFTDNFASIDSTTGGIAGIDNSSEFHQLNSSIETADDKQMDFVRQDIYRYFALNENIIMSKYNEDEFNAFYESVIENIAVQLSLEFTAKLFTEKEKAAGQEVIFSANRLQYSSMTSKINLVKELTPTGLLTINEAREVFNLAGVEGGDKRLISLNYVNADLQDVYQIGQEGKK